MEKVLRLWKGLGRDWEVRESQSLHEQGMWHLLKMGLIPGWTRCSGRFFQAGSFWAAAVRAGSGSGQLTVALPWGILCFQGSLQNKIEVGWDFSMDLEGERCRAGQFLQEWWVTMASAHPAALRANSTRTVLGAQVGWEFRLHKHSP